MKCLDLLQCYFLRLVRQAWVLYSRLSQVLLIALVRQKNLLKKERLLEKCSFVKLTSNFKKKFLGAMMMPQCLLVALVGSSLLLGCSTLRQSQSSAQSTQALNSSRSSHQQTSQSSIYSGDLLSSQSIKEQQSQLQQDTSLLPVLQHLERSLGSISRQQVENKKIFKKFMITLIITAVVCLVGGFVAGLLVANNNPDTVKRAVNLGEEVSGKDKK